MIVYVGVVFIYLLISFKDINVRVIKALQFQHTYIPSQNEKPLYLKKRVSLCLM